MLKHLVSRWMLKCGMWVETKGTSGGRAGIGKEKKFE